MKRKLTRAMATTGPLDHQRGKSADRLREEAAIRMVLDNRPWGAPLPKGWTKVALRRARGDSGSP